MRAYVLIDAQLNRQLLRETDLSQADYAVLVNLSEAPEGRLRGFALAQGMQWEKSRLSHHLTRMERRGLIERQGCPTDGRGAFVACETCSIPTPARSPTTHPRRARSYAPRAPMTTAFTGPLIPAQDFKITLPGTATVNDAGQVVVDLSGEHYVDHEAQVRGWFLLD